MILHSVSTVHIIWHTSVKCMEYGQYQLWSTLYDVWSMEYKYLVWSMEYEHIHTVSTVGRRMHVMRRAYLKKRDDDVRIPFPRYADE